MCVSGHDDWLDLVQLDRNVPRWMPWTHDDTANNDAVWAQMEKDAGITLEQALKKR